VFNGHSHEIDVPFIATRATILAVNLLQPPANSEQRAGSPLLREFSLNLRGQFSALLIDLVLRVEERAALVVALGFEGLDLLLPGEFLFERQSDGRGAAGLLDLVVEFFDFTFEAQFEVVGSAVELLDFGLEEPGVALG